MTRLLAGTVFDRPPHCERCDLPEDQCQCCPPKPEVSSGVLPSEQTARLSIDKRKRGKTVTVIRGLAAADNDLPALLRRLKSHCGAGGSLHENSIEIQGEQRERLTQELMTIGYQVK